MKLTKPVIHSPALWEKIQSVMSKGIREERVISANFFIYYESVTQLIILFLSMAP